MPTSNFYRRKSSRSRKHSRARNTARRLHSGRGVVSYIVERENVIGTNSRVSGDIIKKFVNGTLVAQKFVSTAEIKRAFKSLLAKKKGGMWPFSSSPANPNAAASPVATQPAAVHIQDDTSMWATMKRGFVGGIAFFGAEELMENIFDN